MADRDELPPCPAWCTAEHDLAELQRTGFVFHEGDPVQAGGVEITRMQILEAVRDVPGRYDVDYDDQDLRIGEQALPTISIGGDEAGEPMPLSQLLPVARVIVALGEGLESQS